MYVNTALYETLNDRHADTTSLLSSASPHCRAASAALRVRWRKRVVRPPAWCCHPPSDANVHKHTTALMGGPPHNPSARLSQLLQTHERRQ
jgi:hypothetical protein